MSQAISRLNAFPNLYFSAGDAHNQLGAEIAMLRGELTHAAEIHSEQVREIVLLRREAEAADPARDQLRAEVQQLRQMLNGMTAAQVRSDVI